MKNILLVTIVCTALPAISSNSDSIPVKKNNVLSKNAVYLELGGNGGIYSINYDRIFAKNYDSPVKFSLRVGVEFFPEMLSISGDNLLSPLFYFPSELNLLVGRKHHAEIGLGYTPSWGERYYRYSNGKQVDYIKYNFDYNIVTTLGYRYQRNKKGIIFRVGLNLLFFSKNASKYESDLLYKKFTPWAGISLGYSF